MRLYLISNTCNDLTYKNADFLEVNMTLVKEAIISRVQKGNLTIEKIRTEYEDQNVFHYKISTVNQYIDINSEEIEQLIDILNNFNPKKNRRW